MLEASDRAAVSWRVSSSSRMLPGRNQFRPRPAHCAEDALDSGRLHADRGANLDYPAACTHIEGTRNRARRIWGDKFGYSSAVPGVPAEVAVYQTFDLRYDDGYIHEMDVRKLMRCVGDEVAATAGLDSWLEPISVKNERVRLKDFT